MIKIYHKDSTYSYVEGIFPTLELINNHPKDLVCVYVSSNAISSDGVKKIKQLISDDKFIVSDKALSIVKAKENSHVVGVFNKFSSKLDENENHLVMVNPSDMGNLGNAIRTAIAFNCHNLAIIRPAADVFNPKAVRASMGAIFKINIEQFDSFEEYISKYKREYYPFVLATSKPLSEVSFIKPCSLVFGNEATGLPKEIYNSNNIKIEQSDEVDSLNLTTSIAIGLYKLKIQN